MKKAMPVPNLVPSTTVTSHKCPSIPLICPDSQRVQRQVPAAQKVLQLFSAFSVSLGAEAAARWAELLGQAGEGLLATTCYTTQVEQHGRN